MVMVHPAPLPPHAATNRSSFILFLDFGENVHVLRSKSVSVASTAPGPWPTVSPLLPYPSDS